MLFLQQPLQVFFAGKYGFIFACEDLRVVFRQGHFDNGIVLILAENDANRRIFFRQLHFAVVVVNIHLHLSDVLMLQLSDFQIEQHKAAEQAVIEHQIDHEMLFVKGKTNLPPDECEAGTKLQQELLQVVDDPAFQFAFRIFRQLRKP